MMKTTVWSVLQVAFIRMKWDKLNVKDAVMVHLFLNGEVLEPKLPTAWHVRMVRSPTRLLNIVHADAYTTSIGWIVSARAQHVHHTVFFVRKIQQYLLLTTSGNGRTIDGKSFLEFGWNF
ncbi:uncharacterized protein LOC113686159 [Pocillopora damicornis]|uniref:uncharacterized protein LOC113686159 n=1 Tax=Pocillopora damicornis TaxID=46731 RepID=UPI000F554453|nr:uncharacterized protein LOC113686159 [Pocillopora damicornis]